MSRTKGGQVHHARSWVTYDTIARNYLERFRAGAKLVSLELSCKDQDANDMFALRVCQELKRLGLPSLVDYIGPGEYHFRVAPDVKGGGE